MLGGDSDSDDEDDGTDSEEETPKKVCFDPNLVSVCSCLFENLKNLYLFFYTCFLLALFLSTRVLL